MEMMDIFAIDFNLTTPQSYVQLSLLIIIVAVIIIAASLIVYVLASRKSREEQTAKHVLKKVQLMREGKFKAKPELTEKKQEKEEKKEAQELSKSNSKASVPLKQIIIQKFQPIVEKQLQTKVEFHNLIASGDNFNAEVSVGGVKLLLVLDSGGKIIDYKRKKLL